MTYDSSYEQKIMLWASQIMATLALIFVLWAFFVDHFKVITVTGEETTQEERAPIILKGLAEYYAVSSEGIKSITCAVDKLHYEPNLGNTAIPYEPIIACDLQQFMALHQQLDSKAKQVPQSRTVKNPEFDLLMLLTLFASLISIAIAAFLGMERNKSIKALDSSISSSDPASYMIIGLILLLLILTSAISATDSGSYFVMVITIFTISAQIIFHAMLPPLTEQKTSAFAVAGT